MKTTKVNVDDPEVKRLLRRIAEHNKSDPFAVRRFLSHCQAGIIDIRDLLNKKNFGVL